MDKAQAIQLIREEYQNGYSPSDIAQNLSQGLNAPFDLVYKFVMHTLDKEIEPAEEPIPAPSPPAPPEPVAPAMPEYQALPEIQPGDAAYSPAAAEASVLIGTSAPDLKALEQNPKVEKYVLQQLKSNRKTSDTVMAVCERTGLGWEEAQRLVAHIAAKNHKTLRTRQNLGPIILSTMAVLAGGILIFAGLNEALNIYTALQGTHSTEELVALAASQEFLRNTFWALAIGGSLLLGGAVGLFIALRNQFE